MKKTFVVKRITGHQNEVVCDYVDVNDNGDLLFMLNKRGNSPTKVIAAVSSGQWEVCLQKPKEEKE